MRISDWSSDVCSSDLARYQDVQVCRLHNNTGASGGFSLGFQLGYATGADFIWAMDDDVIPDQNALQKMLDARSCLEDQSVYPPYIVSTARTAARDLTNTPGVARGRNVLNYPAWPRFLEHGLVPTAQATFVSILIGQIGRASGRERMCQFGVF